MLVTEVNLRFPAGDGHPVNPRVTVGTVPKLFPR